jgi:hypothetical protein
MSSNEYKNKKIVTFFNKKIFKLLNIYRHVQQNLALVHDGEQDSGERRGALAHRP